MAFHVEYGGYVHDDAEVAIDIQRQSLVSDTGRHYGERITWTLSGILQAADDSALDVAIDALETAYSLDGGNLKLVKGSGADTEHVILNAGSLGGVRVISGPSYPEGNRGEYTSFRTYTITLEADLPLTTDNVYLRYEESLEFVGDGGPQFTFLPTLTGNWQKQQTTQTSTYQVIQTGSAVGLYAVPAPNAPLWPAAEHTDRRRIRPRTGRFRFNQATGLYEQYEFPISWTYVFEDTGALSGVPVPI